MTAAPFTTTDTRRRAPFVAVQVAQLIAVFGNSLTAIAIPWFVLETTGSAGQTGIVAAAGLIPAVIALAIGGAAIDRIGFRPMSVLSDALSMVTVAAIPLLYVTVGLPLPALLALVFLGALFDPPGSTARAAMRPDLARMGGITLARANGIDQGGIGLATLLGPLVGGVLIGFIGAQNVLWFNAATFALSVILVIAFVPRDIGRTRSDEAPAALTAPAGAIGAYLGEVRAGWAYVWRQPLIRRITSLSVICNFVLTSVFAVLLPVLVNEQVGEPRALGVIVAAFSVGMLLGLGVYSWLGDRLPRVGVTVGGIFALAGLCAALATGWPWPVLAVAVATGGLLSAAVNPVVMTVLQETVPESLRGRVMGAVFAGGLLATPLGVLLAGSLAEVVRLAPIFLGGAALLAAVGVVAALDPTIRAIGAAPTGHDAAGRPAAEPVSPVSPDAPAA